MEDSDFFIAVCKMIPRIPWWSNWNAYEKVCFSFQESPIIDFYPTDFKIDLNGKKYAWQGKQKFIFFQLPHISIGVVLNCQSNCQILHDRNKWEYLFLCLIVCDDRMIFCRCGITSLCWWEEVIICPWDSLPRPYRRWA